MPSTGPQAIHCGRGRLGSGRPVTMIVPVNFTEVMANWRYFEVSIC